MSEITNVIEIDATPARVWAVLGDLEATPDWLPGTVSARVDGPIRVCVMADGTEVREQIDSYSAEDRTYHWRHLQVPLPVKGSHGTFTVDPSGDGSSTVILRTHFEPLGGAEVIEMIQNAFATPLRRKGGPLEHGMTTGACESIRHGELR